MIRIGRLLGLLTCLLASGVARAQLPTGAVRGTVLDADFELALGGAQVTVLETRQQTATTPDGNFLLDGLSPGRYTLRIAKLGFQRRLVSGVIVTTGGLADLRVLLDAEVVEMDEMVVTGADFLAGSEIGALELRAAAVTVQDSISAELIGRAGVSDVAGALKLVVGASVAQGKYATVRGLSDRYTGTTLNGVRVPSADPRRRAVQVDLFPTGTIESVTVTKTFTPDLQGDFTGGGVDIRTKSIPDGLLLSASVGFEDDSLATGQTRFLTYRGGGVTSTARAGGDRELPALAREPVPPFPSFSTNPTEARIEASEHYDALTHSFAGAMGISRRAPESNYSFSLVGGNRWELKRGGVLGALGAVTWTRKASFYEGATNDKAVVSDPSAPIAVVAPRTDFRGTQEVLVGSLATFVWQLSDLQELSFKAISNRSAEDQARLQVQDPDQRVVEQNQSLHYTERRLLSLQLAGHHRLGDRGDEGGHWLDLDWTLADNGTRQWEPDVRFFRNSYDTDTFSSRRPSNSTNAQNTRRIFRDLVEDNVQLKVDAKTPLARWSDEEATVQVGIFGEDTRRQFDQRSFTYVFPNQFGLISNDAVRANRARASWSGESPEDLWTDVFTDADRTGLASNDPPAPNQLLWSVVPLGDDVDYAGDQRIEAAYAMVELPLLPTVTLTAGARWERTKIAVEPVNEEFGVVEVVEIQPGGARAVVEVPQEDAATSIEESSWLPAVNVTWALRPTMNLRFAWSRTLARPTFRELAPAATEEFIFGDEFLGNPELTLSQISNWDLRWEWFRRPGDVLAVSVFQKELRDPIEYLSFSASNRSFVQPVNFGTGRLRGVEVEARTGLDVFWKRLADFTLGVNVTLLDAKVEVPLEEQDSLAAFGLEEPTRRLQGQPEHLFNASLTWDHERSGVSAGLFYNVVGDTLLTGAARGVEDGSPNVFETSHETLNLNVKKSLPHGVALAFKAKNLLRDGYETVYRRPDGEEAVKERREGALRLSLSASWTW